MVNDTYTSGLASTLTRLQAVAIRGNRTYETGDGKLEQFQVAVKE